MKTISNLIKEIFAVRRTDKERSPVISPPVATTDPNEEKPEEGNKEIQDHRPVEEHPVKQPEKQNQLSNSQSNETKTDENCRDPHMDHPDVRETDGSDQKLQESESGKPTGETRRGRRAEQPGLMEEPEVKEAIQKAYERGVIADRNEKIEEIYFPKEDDGIPHFHGAASTSSPVSDIFSIAREA